MIRKSFAFAVAAFVSLSAMAKDTTCKASAQRLPIFATSNDPKEVNACVQITEVSGRPTRYKLEFCSTGQFHSPCTPLGPNPKGLYTEAELVAAQRRICESKRFCSVETAVKGIGSAAVLAATIVGAGAFTGPAAFILASPICVSEAYVGYGLTTKAAARADDTGKCYDAVRLVQKGKDGAKAEHLAGFAKDVQGKAIVLERAKLTQVAQRFNQLLDPNYKDQVGLDFDPNHPVSYPTPGDH